MTGTTTMRHHSRSVLLITSMLALAACGKKTENAAAAAAPPPPMSLGAENILVIQNQQIHTGPTISGSLAPEQVATVRAEVGGAVEETYAQEGDPVKAGAPLARLDDSAIRDAMTSAESAVKTALSNQQMAQREVDRSNTLLKAGAIPEHQVEQAQTSLTSSQSAVADAQARLASAKKQWEQTQVKAPFSGVVSARTVNTGDVVSIGTALYTVVNPAKMKFDANIPAEALEQVHQGSSVQFTVTGYGDRQFTGQISRINPVADPATRQVRVTVTLPNDNGSLVGGLFADGRVSTESRMAPVVPTAAVDEHGVRPTVMQVKNGKVQKTEVQLGLRDAASETVEIKSGLSPKDTILIGQARNLAPGTVVRVTTLNDVKK